MEAGRQALERGEFRQAVWEATSIKDPPKKKKKDTSKFLAKEADLVHPSFFFTMKLKDITCIILTFFFHIRNLI